jgi:NitT/TauT family transport system ATP-binding protein
MRAQSLPSGGIVEFREVTKTFADPKGAPIDVVQPFSLTIAKGEFVVFVGPSGCGKTTVMRMAGGLETPTTGEILLDGERIIGPSREKGMVFQSYSSFPWLKVLANVRFGLRFRPELSPAHKERIANRYLDLVGLTPFADYYVNRISGGMRQRVAIARTLAADPQVLLMDEPFGALDALTRERLQLQLRELQKAERKTTIFVTHDVNEAVFLADRIIVFSARPTRILREVPVAAELPGDRTLDITETPIFQRLRREVLTLIRQEELRAEEAEFAGAP